MIILSCEKVSKSFGINTVLNNISFSLKEGSRTGIIGTNGAGKTTLFNLITGKYSPDSGQIYMARDITTGYLEQNESVDSSNTIWNELLSVFNDIISMEKQIRNLELEISKYTDTDDPRYTKLLDDYAGLTDEFSNSDGFSYESLIRGTLAGLGFKPSEYHQPIWQLSGGQKTRVALGKLLLKKTQLLLLDEPTNYLDLESTRWLENYLTDYSGTVMVISHDRFFLDRVCNSILEVENCEGSLYDGNYTAYRLKKEELKKLTTKNYTTQQKEIKRQEAIIERFRSFNREKSIKAAESRQKALDKLERIEKPVFTEDISMSFDIKRQSGYEVLKINDLAMGFNEATLFENVSFHLNRGDRVGIIGGNGTGKTTLLKLILGQYRPLAGDITIGAGVEIGSYEQEQTDLNPDNTVIDELWDDFPSFTETRIRNTLALFLFKGDDVYKSIGSLSGGEKSRIKLAKLMLADKNFLLLDEPTNHLDMTSKEVLEKSLKDYPGTILTVSHDRYFLDKIVNKILVLENNEIAIYQGNYTYYVDKVKSKELLMESKDYKDNGSIITKTAQKEARRKEREERLKVKEQQKRINEIEALIQSLEEQLDSLEKELCNPTLYKDTDRMLSTQNEYNKIKASLEEAYDEWESMHSY